jgi:hypothetical protein
MRGWGKPNWVIERTMNGLFFSHRLTQITADYWEIWWLPSPAIRCDARWCGELRGMI